jgi:hypothetical protein
MVSPNHPLLQLLALIDMVWAESEMGPPKRLARVIFFKNRQDLQDR